MNELYHQMTLDEWAASKNRIREMIRKAKTAFIVIGYELRRIEEAEAYKLDGYASLAEFAKTEYGFEKTMTSRLVEVNKTFSEGGYSDILIEDAEGFTFTKLVEMKDLPVEDLQVVRPETKREDIRELKRFEASAPEGGSVDELLIAFFRKEKDALNEIFERFRDGLLSQESEIAEIISPTGNKTFRKGMYMAFFYKDNVVLKNRTGQILEWPYEELFAQIRRIFDEAAAAGGNVWEAYYGEPEEKPQETAEEPAGSADSDKTVQERAKSLSDGQKSSSDGQKSSSDEHKTSKISKEPHKTEQNEDKGEQPETGEESANEPGKSGADPAEPDRGTAEDSGEAAGRDSEERQGDLGGENEPATEPERAEKPDEAVAPAQQEGETAGRAEEKNRLAARIDEALEALGEDIGSGRYDAALETAERMCKDLTALTALLHEH